MKQKYVGLFYFTLGLVAMGTSAYADPDPHNVLVSKSYLTSVMPAAQVQSDWNASTGMGAILNKPNLATVATSGSYNDLTDKPTIPTLPTGTEGNVVTYNSNGAIGGSVPTYAGATTQNPYNAANDAGKIATMGAVMTAITASAPATLTVGSSETAAIGAYSTTFAASGTNVWPAGDASLFVDGTALATGLSLKQNIIPAYASGGSESLLTDGATDGTVGKVAIATEMGTNNATNNAKIPTVGLLRTQLANKQNDLGLTDITTQFEMAATLPRMSLNNVALDRDALYLVPAAAAASDDKAITWMDNGRGYVLTQDAVTAAMGKLYDDVKIPATRSDSYSDGKDTAPSLVGTTDTAGTIGQHLLASGWSAPLTNANNAPAVKEFIEGDHYTASTFATASGLSNSTDVKWAIPSLQLLSGMYGEIKGNVNTKQNTIPKAGYAATGGASSNAYNTNGASDRKSWLSADVAGSGLITKTSTDGTIGERKIFEVENLTGDANAHITAYSDLTGNNKLIADISIPTVGAMMTAITNNSSALIPAGTDGDLVTYTGIAGTVGSTTPASAPSYNASTGALENGTAIATIAAVDTMQKKIDANDSTTYPNGSVVTYGTTAGTPGQVAIATAPSYNQQTGELSNGDSIPTMGAVMAETAAVDVSSHTVNGAPLSNSASYFYGTSDTAADTATKVVSIPSITTLATGQIIVVQPSVTATVKNINIKLNNFDAKAVMYNNAATSATTSGYAWSENYPSIFVYDGTYWRFLAKGNDINTNTTYSAMSVAEGTTGTATSSRTVRADYLKQIIQGTKLTGLDTTDATAVAATDTVLGGIGKLQAQINAAVDTMQKKAVCTQWSDADVQAGTQTRCWAYTFTDINVTVAANND